VNKESGKLETLNLNVFQEYEIHIMYFSFNLQIELWEKRIWKKTL